VGDFCFIQRLLSVSFFYFFRADKAITRGMVAVINKPSQFKSSYTPHVMLSGSPSRMIKVQSYLSTPLTVKPVRNVSHYSSAFIDSIFSRHHFAAMLSILIAFIFLVTIGFFLDHPILQLPAAASVTIFLAILVAVAGAFSYFLQNWSVPFFIGLWVVLNILYQYEIIDPTNKAYGINYAKQTKRAAYTESSLRQLCTSKQLEADKRHMITILNRWKNKQKEKKPLLFLLSVSGGGTRSATFTLSTLQRLDSLCGGSIMNKTFAITGASGGMLGAAYYRAITHEKGTDTSIIPTNRTYVDDISKDLLNATLSSFVARDLAAPAQKFKSGNYYYIKDRGYAFEQKLNANTRGLLNQSLKELAAEEEYANMPLMFFNSVITRDGRKMIVSTQPVSFLMKPAYPTIVNNKTPGPDAVDFGALFKQQDAMNLSLLTALRMNATFPYVLPNVWLPTEPVIDVMDAGLRDNYGPETILRFVDVFKDWIANNTAGVVLIQITDRKTGGWDNPFESKDISELVTKPLLLLQYNWYKMQEFNQDNTMGLSQQLLKVPFHQITFEYVTGKEHNKAALNFHLTQREKKDILASLNNSANTQAFDNFLSLLQDNVSTANH
jgi:hypothetical protein